jgi:hypothetical protein
MRMEDVKIRRERVSLFFHRWFTFFSSTCAKKENEMI